ncbi:serum opacification factor [Streptococcus dysgalactiae]|uniref:serum opacification factor n=1 Tax=Streptococcus dysgalactiae TaxID=1334 RepID=UPI0024B647B9|nr:serum opacification factor [Streptococcus dysgalactiae]
MTNCKYKLRKLSIGLVSVGTMFMAAPVMGEEVSQTTASRETPSASSATTSSTTQSGESQDLKEAEVAETPKQDTKVVDESQDQEAAPVSQTSPSPLTAGTAKSPQEEETVVKTQNQESTPKATDGTEVRNTTNQEFPQGVARQRSKRAEETVPQTMEVEKLEVDKEKSEVDLVDGEKGTKKLIANRDGEQREIAEIIREVRVGDKPDELEVTLKVTPKEIDKGAEVIVLLDTSKKMTDGDYDTAKENIKKLVTTLTAKDVKHTNRNSVRLIDFYRHINEPVNLSGKTAEQVDEILEKLRKKAKADYNGWGVDLQGAIHTAREIFNKEKQSGKRQHIVLFSQGESTFSYDIKDKSKVDKVAVEEPVTYSNPLLFWPFYFDTTTRTHNVVNDAEKLIGFLNKLGISQFNGAIDGVAKGGNIFLGLGSLLGFKNPLDYISLADLETNKLDSEKFDYSKRVGEGYNFRSYSDREVYTVGFKSILAEKIKGNLKKSQPKQVNTWLSYLGLDNISEKIQDWMIDKALDNLFYRRQYQFYNHNLSAQAEAKMARDEGIKFYAFDVTDPKRILKELSSKNYGEAYTNHLKKKAEEAKKIAEARDMQFDKYLKEMSEEKDFLKDVSEGEKFKDLLTEVNVTETFEEKVSVNNDDELKKNKEVKHTQASSNSSIFSFIFSSSTKESLTWTLSKEKLQAALQSGKTLTLTYKLKVNKDKFKPDPKKRAKRSLDTSESKEPETAKVISGNVSYKINGQKGKETKLTDVNVTYSKEIVRKPQVEPNVPETPETPEEKPLTPLAPSEPSQPSLPEIPMPEVPTEREPEIISNSGLVEFTEVTQSGMSGQNPDSVEEIVVEDSKPDQGDEIIIGGQGQVIDFTEDTQSGMSGALSPTEESELTEDSQVDQDDIVLGGQGQVIDFTEDTQIGMSGDNSHMDETVVEEDTKPSQEDEVIIGGQGQVIDFTEDTQIGMSGAGQVENPTITEETHKPEIIMGGQSDPIDMVEDTLPGMSGSNEATVVEEDTRPKLQFHFDNEEPVPATVPTVSQAPITQVESKVPHAKAESALPQTGDTNKLETFFAITALTVIGAAGLLGKKRRDNQTD